jgi:hypothetical protein
LNALWDKTPTDQIIKSPSTSRSLPCKAPHSCRSFGESLRLHALHQNLGRVRSGFKNAHRFGNVVAERERTRVAPLVRAHEFGLNIGRRKFKHLDIGVAELPPERLRIGMDRGFGRAVSWRYRNRNEGKAGGDHQHACPRLAAQMGQEGGRQPDWTEQVRRPGRRVCSKGLAPHDPGIID